MQNRFCFFPPRMAQPAAGGRGFPSSCIWRAIHAISRFTIFSCWRALSSIPFGTRYHLLRHPRQQQAQACCARKTGWPCMGVCRPSFGMTAGASRCRTKSCAWRRIISMPFSRTYALSFSLRVKLDRNLEVWSFASASSIVCMLFAFFLVYR